MAQPLSTSGQLNLRWIIFLVTSLLVNAPVGNAQINSEVTITSAFVSQSEGDPTAINVMLSASNSIINGVVDVAYCGNLASDDFTVSPPATVTFMGSSAEVISLVPSNDQILEGTEAFDIILTGIQDMSMSQTLTIGTARQVRVEITDDDAEFIFLDAMTYVAETVGMVDVFVAASKDVAALTDITLEIRDLSGVDASCVLPAGLTDGNTFMCPSMAIGDQYATCSVSFTASGCFGLILQNVDDMMASTTVAEVFGTTSATTTVSIVPTGSGEISFAESFLFAREDAGTVDVVIVSSDVAGAVTNIPITVQAVAAGDVAAAQFDDFTVDSFATLPMGGTRATATVTITDDSNLECLESIVLNLAAPGGETIVEPMSVTLYIEDNDPAVTVSINTATITVNENDGCFNVGLTSSATSECPYTGSYDLCGFTATPNEDIFASCFYQLPSASTSQQLRLCINDDVLQEGTETLYLSVMPPSPFGSVTNGFAEITINDNEATGANVAALSVGGGSSSGTVTEAGTTTLDLEVSVTTAFIGSVTLGYGGGDLTEPDDFTISTNTLLFDGSNTVATATVTAVDDTVAEYLSESLEIFIIDSDIPVDPASSTVTITVEDDDIELSLYPTIVEAGENTAINFVLVLDKEAPASAVTTNILTATDISTTTADYTLPGTVDIAMNDRFVEFQVSTNNDAVVETLEVVEIIATVGTASVTSTMTILDSSDFGGKSVQLLNSNNAVTEATASAVMLSFIIPGAGTYSLAFADSTVDATSGSDFSIAPASPINVPGTTIDITVIDDDVMEVNFENVLVTFTADDVYPQQTASVTIVDNEGPADICCARAINYACEGDSVALVEFEYKSAAPAGGINIDLAILYADGTAEQTIDFDSVTSSINIDMMAVFTATVSIIQDIEPESDEEFYVYIEHNAYLNPSIATCTVIILDDDYQASTTLQPSTTAPQSSTLISTTQHATTTDSPTTTDIATTTADVTTTNRPTTTQFGTSTQPATTTEVITTTERATTTEVETTTGQPTTTERATTTEFGTTTGQQSTTESATTTQFGTSTQPPTTTEVVTTTERATTTEIETTTGQPTTTERATTTEFGTTTGQQSTTERATTTQFGTSTQPPTTTEVITTTERATTTEIETTTGQPTTTERATTTEFGTTTGQQSTTERATTTQFGTSTQPVSTTERATTTEFGSTTQPASTTEGITTTEKVTTTEIGTTTGQPSTTERATTTQFGTTTQVASTTARMTTTQQLSTTQQMSSTEEETTTVIQSTTEQPSTTGVKTTTDILTTTVIPTTTQIGSTTQLESTTEFQTTTHVASTTERETTTNVPSTTPILSTTGIQTTTDKKTTTQIPTTTGQPSTTEMETTSVVPTTTQQPTTTEQGTTTNIPSTTRLGSTTEMETTTEQVTTTQIPTTTAQKTSTDILTTTVIPTTTQIGSTTQLESTTDFQTTTHLASTTERETTTNVPSTTPILSTTGIQTTTDKITTTQIPTTTGQPSTTEMETTSVVPTTTQQPTTTEQGTTTNIPSTTRLGSTTEMETTTERVTTTQIPTTTAQKSSTNILTTTVIPTTTQIGSTTQSETTTDLQTTTHLVSTTERETTTNVPSTTLILSTTGIQSTTDKITTTHILTTTGQPSTTEMETTSVVPTTTQQQSTTDEGTTSNIPSTTKLGSTTEMETTTEKITTTQIPTTTGQPSTTEKATTSVVPTTTQQQSTTDEGTTSNIPSTTKFGSTTELETTTEQVTTTQNPTTTAQKSSTNILTTTAIPTTTQIGSTTQSETTSDFPSTTRLASTTDKGTTTNVPSTTPILSSTGKQTTTDKMTTTKIPTTTGQPSTTEKATTSVVPTTTQQQSTTDEGTTSNIPSTTKLGSTTEMETTTEKITTTQIPTTTGQPSTTEKATTSVVPTTTQQQSTTDEGTTSNIPSTTKFGSTTEMETTTDMVTTTDTPSTTQLHTTTQSETTTDIPTTTQRVSSTESHTTSEVPTTTVPISTTDSETTTNVDTTTQGASTTHILTSTVKPSTTWIYTTTAGQSTTGLVTTSEIPSTSVPASTTAKETTTQSQSSTEPLSTTDKRTTTDLLTSTLAPSSTAVGSTTGDPTTTLLPTTTLGPSTTEAETTTNGATSTAAGSTTKQATSSAAPSTTLHASSTDVASTTFETTSNEGTSTVGQSTTDFETSSEVETTTGERSTTEADTTTDAQTTTSVLSTTEHETTSEAATSSAAPSSTAALSSSEGQTSSLAPSTTHAESTTDFGTSTHGSTRSQPMSSTEDHTTSRLPETSTFISSTLFESSSEKFSSTISSSTAEGGSTSEGPTSTAVSSTFESTSQAASTTVVTAGTEETTSGVPETTSFEMSTQVPISTGGPSATPGLTGTTGLPSVSTGGPSISTGGPSMSTGISVSEFTGTQTTVSIQPTGSVLPTGTVLPTGSTGPTGTVLPTGSTELTGGTQATDFGTQGTGFGTQTPDGVSQRTGLSTSMVEDATTGDIITTASVDCLDSCTAGNFLCCESCIPPASVCDLQQDCSDGRDESLPNCRSCTLDTVANADFIGGTEARRHGQTIVYMCQDGFSLASGERTFSYQCRDGEWDRPDPLPVCEEACDSPSFQCIGGGGCIDRANVCDGTTNCEDGSDESNETCDDTCPTAEPPANGFEINSLPRYLENETATFGCNSTFTLNGNAVITCINGTFQPGVPQCLGSCSSLGNVFSNAQLISENLGHGRQIVYNCNSGFELADSSTTFSFTCNNGVWIANKLGQTPVCSEVQGPCSSCLANEVCVNNACVCSTGYERVNTACTDVNECLTMTCPTAGQACINSLGSFICKNVTQILYDYASGTNVRSLFTANAINNVCISPYVSIPGGLVVGNQTVPYLYFTCNGVVIYGDMSSLSPRQTFDDPASFNGTETLAMSAVFWAEADFTSRGNMYYQAYQAGGNEGEDDTVLSSIQTQVRDNDQDASDNNYTPIWALIITWEDVPQPDDNATLYPYRLNRYQAVVSTNGIQTYILQLYQEGDFQWSVPSTVQIPVVIGYTDGDGEFENAHQDQSAFPDVGQQFDIDQRVGNTNSLGQWIFRLDQKPYTPITDRSQCRIRYFNDLSFTASELLNAPLCPCTLSAGNNDASFTNCRRPQQAALPVESIVGNLTSQILGNCLQQLTPTNVTTNGVLTAQYGSYCYYDSEENLVSDFSTSVWTSSYAQRWHNRVAADTDITNNWIEQDILFRYYCCGASSSTTASCSLYESRRPKLTCSGSLSLATADVAGDPHFITMDGARFTFNGLGEFVMIHSKGPVGFQLQCRTGLAQNHLNETVPTATVFIGFALEFKGHKVEVLLDEERSEMAVWFNEALLTDLNVDEPFFTQDWQVILLKEVNGRTGREELVTTLSLDSGNTTKLVFAVVSGTLSVRITSKGAMVLNSVGLLGSKNNNLTDDFLFPNGSKLDVKEGEVLTDSKVYPFGLAWRTSPDTSLFTYQEGESWESINDNTHMPVFFEDLIEDPSLTDRLEEVRRECGGVKECMFDALITNNMDLAIYTKKYVEEDLLNRKIAANTPPSFVSLTEIHGELGQHSVRDNTTLLVQKGYNYTYRIIFFDPDETDNVTIRLRDNVFGAFIEDGNILHYSPQDVDPVQITLVATDGLVGINQPLTVLMCNCFGGVCNYNRLQSGSQVIINKFALVECDCLDSFTGPECRGDYDSCTDHPCFTGVTCIDHPPPEDTPTCSMCPSPLLGDGSSCQDFDECASSSSNLCQQDCVNMEGSYKCACRPGYELLPDGYNCQDVNECDTGEHNCGHGASCTNTMGSYRCNCPTGFAVSSDESTCLDINECLDGQVCFAGAWCYNTLGSYRCECPLGFVRVGQQCTDLNECLSADLHTCGPNAECVNALGSYRCVCKSGYQGVGTSCVDRNECTISAYYCHPKFKCTNLEPGYTCLCPDGFEGDGKKCFDIDECSLGSQYCPQHSTCTNTPGSYSCTCHQGFRENEDGRCINIDECAENPFICGNFECIDTEGSFICECPPDTFRHEFPACLINGKMCQSNDIPIGCVRKEHQDGGRLDFNCLSNQFCKSASCSNSSCYCDNGYELSDFYDRCVDINECLYQMDNCESNEECINTPGSFSCECLPGFVKNGTYCQDVNECEESTELMCDRNAYCVNIPGSYQCRCKEMYEGNGIDCIDKNECTQGPGCGPNAICENTSPGYNCRCAQGFEENGTECKDIDECLTSPCVTNSTCYNTPGSFYCSCTPGFFGDGRIGQFGCHDVDECFARQDACPEFSTCTNSEGTYACDCFRGYRPEDSQCVDVDECLEGYHDCDGNATCVNLGGSFTCRCNEGFFSYGVRSGAGTAHGHGACKDIDECLLGVHSCHEYADCTNEIGGYRCQCRTGYNGDGFSCTDTDECETSIPCSSLPNKICLNREGSYQCVCQYGFSEDEDDSCIEADTIQLNIIFTDIKGLQTQIYYNSITEKHLDQLTEDIRILFEDSSIAQNVLNLRINSLQRTETGYALLALRVDLDVEASLSPEDVLNTFMDALSGREKRLVPPDSRILSATAEIPAIDPCRTGSHNCFEMMFQRCVYSGQGLYQCLDCPEFFRHVDGTCVADPCQTGDNDCQARHFDICVFQLPGDFLCEDCSEGFVPEFEDNDLCIPDPCMEGQKICSRQNFNRCIVDGTNRFHCEECKEGFRLENGRCIGDSVTNPCFKGENTCTERLYLNCIYDIDANDYHCEDCRTGYKEEGDHCVADPCQQGLNDCRERNFERCLYQSGGGFTCEKCKAGFIEEEGKCVRTAQPGFRRLRGTIRVVAINGSADLAIFHSSLQDLTSRPFKDYEIHFCDVFTYVLSQSQIVQQDFIQCFILSFREGSIISHFVIDVQARNNLQPQDFEDIMLAGASRDSQGLILYNRFRTRSLTIDGSSVDFVDTSTFGCNRNLICLNGGTCIEDSSVYEYACSCPSTYTGDRCHIAVQTTATTVPPREEPTTSTPTVLLVVITVVVLFMVLILSMCCCCVMMSNMTAKRQALEQQRMQGMYRTPGPRPDSRYPGSDPNVVRNILARKLAALQREGLEMDEPKDYSERNISRDERRLRHLSNVLRHADFLNERMLAHGSGHSEAVYNPAFSDDESEDSSRRHEFDVPLVADGSELTSIHKDALSEWLEMDSTSTSDASTELPPYSELEEKQQSAL